jgi:hypothetical protein
MFTTPSLLKFAPRFDKPQVEERTNDVLATRRPGFKASRAGTLEQQDGRTEKPEGWNQERSCEEISKRKTIPQDEKSARLVVDRKKCSFRFDIIHPRILTVCQIKSELLQSSR